MLMHGGYRRTSLRLAVFGLLACVPFIAITKLTAGWWPLIMIVTLLVAVLTAWLVDLCRPGAMVAACLTLVWGGALGEYWWPAIGLCLCVWAYQRQPSKALLPTYLGCLVILWFVNGNFWALVAVPVLWVLQRWPIALPRLRWAFYAFYPLHLALFWLLLSSSA